MAVQLRTTVAERMAAADAASARRRADEDAAAERRRADEDRAAAVKATKQAAKDRAAAQRNERREAARARFRARVAVWREKSVFVAPLLLITAFAVYGQFGYGYDNYTPDGTYEPTKIAIALGAALALEAITNFLQYLSYRARTVYKASSRAAALARWSYVIALGVVAPINFAHFYDTELGKPTVASFVFAAFSAASPWLWAQYAKSAEDEQRAEDGTADSRGAVFSAERWRQFPILTYRARRYSVMHNIDDPRRAWEEYMAEYRAEQRARAADRTAAAGGEVAGGATRRGGAAGGGETRGAAGGATAGGRGGEVPAGRRGEVPAERPAPGAGASGGAGAGGRVVPPVPPAPPAPDRASRTVGDNVAAKARLRRDATDWAVTEARRVGSVPGWRTIINAATEGGALLFPGIGEYAAKGAATDAKTRLGETTAAGQGSG